MNKDLFRHQLLRKWKFMTFYWIEQIEEELARLRYIVASFTDDNKYTKFKTFQFVVGYCSKFYSCVPLIFLLLLKPT